MSQIRFALSRILLGILTAFSPPFLDFCCGCGRPSAPSRLCHRFHRCQLRYCFSEVIQWRISPGAELVQQHHGQEQPDDVENKRARKVQQKNTEKKKEKFKWERKVAAGRNGEGGKGLVM